MRSCTECSISNLRALLPREMHNLDNIQRASPQDHNKDTIWTNSSIESSLFLVFRLLTIQNDMEKGRH
jgi:hypothetical protein